MDIHWPPNPSVLLLEISNSCLTASTANSWITPCFYKTFHWTQVFQLAEKNSWIVVCILQNISLRKFWVVSLTRTLIFISFLGWCFQKNLFFSIHENTACDPCYYLLPIYLRLKNSDPPFKLTRTGLCGAHWGILETTNLAHTCIIILSLRK